MSVPARFRRSDAADIELPLPTAVLGRDPSCDVHLDAQPISRRHAIVAKTAHGYTIADLESRNGTFLNGERVSATPHPLRDGDEVVMAGVETLVFVDPLATPMAPAIGRLSGVWIDPETAAVWVDAQLVEPPLSARQHALLELLVANEGELVSRHDVVAVVWADVASEGVSAEAIDALVKRVRARIRPLQIHGDYLEIVRGRGMRLSYDDSP